MTKPRKSNFRLDDGGLVHRYLQNVMKKIKNYDGVLKGWEDRHVYSGRSVFGQTIYEPGGYCGPRIQRDFEFVILHSGSAKVLVDGKSLNLRPGMVYLFLPNHREEYRFATNCRTHHSWFTLQPELLNDEIRRLIARAPREAPPSDFFTTLMTAIFLINPVQDEIRGQAIDHVALALCAEYLGITRSVSGNAEADLCVARALRHMEDHYSEPDCLATTLAIAHCSRTGFHARFVRATKLPPDRYLWRLRTEKGIALLSATGLTVAEIADRCGFQNPFHFSRLVKRLNGSSPRMIRELAWSGKRTTVS